MLVAGIRCTKDKLDWAVIRGHSRLDPELIEQRQATMPAGTRGAQLAWARKEVHELTGRHALDAAAVRVSEPAGQSFSPGRSEAEGVVQEALYSAGIDPAHHVAASVRSAFKARSTADLNNELAKVPIVAATPKSRQEPVISAVALMPA
jgi:hypothetical protein